MKTKAELEAELHELQLEVAGLRAAVEAYRFAFERLSPQTVTWNDQWLKPQVFPTWQANT